MNVQRGINQKNLNDTTEKIEEIIQSNERRDSKSLLKKAKGTQDNGTSHQSLIGRITILNTEHT